MFSQVKKTVATETLLPLGDLKEPYLTLSFSERKSRQGDEGE